MIRYALRHLHFGCGGALTSGYLAVERVPHGKPPRGRDAAVSGDTQAPRRKRKERRR